MLRAEMIKLRRSSTWVVVLVLPLVAVVAGSANLARNVEVLDGGWSSLTSQVVLFYGLLFFSMGVALVAATVWRGEHRGGSWNHLLASTTHLSRLLLAKVVAVLLPVAVMQVVLVVAVAVSGLLVLKLPGPPPWQLAAVCALAAGAALPLAVAQSLLSLLVRSFAVPVAVCLVGCMAGIVVVSSAPLRPLVYVLPQAMVTRLLSLGSSAVSDAGRLTLAGVVPVLAAAGVLAAVLAALSLLLLRTVRLR